MEIEHLSVSRRGVYFECPAQYKYRYHLRLPRDEGIDEPFYFIYGKIVHKIAEEYVLRKGNMPLNEISNEVLVGNIEVEEGVKAPKLPNEYKKKLPEHIRSIKRLHDKIGLDGFAEYDFYHDLEHPNKKFVKGFIDRIVIKGDKYFLFDYKTTKRGRFRKNKATIVNDVQLRVYASVIRKNFGVKAENIRAALYYLEGADLFPVTFTEKALDNTEKELLETYNRILSHDPNNIIPNVGNHCKRCDYRFSCPFIKLT